MNDENFEIHKDFLDLAGYNVLFGDISIVPVKIDADSKYCVIEFLMINKRGMERHIVRKGTHENFVFKTSIGGMSFTINMKTNVIKKIRDRK